jgi:hypothetical protein
MVCPISGKLCKNCALYNGRHYFLCFFSNHNDCSEMGMGTKLRAQSSGAKSSWKFEIPSEFKCFDPFTAVSEH